MCSNCGDEYRETIEADARARRRAEERAEMKVICAWCGKTLREAAPGHEQDGASHGICQECATEQKAGLVGSTNISWDKVAEAK